MTLGNRPRRSYFKMDVRALRKEGVLERAKAAWVAHPRWAKDKRKRWALALRRIRMLLKCKITWIKEGDASSKYFFARLKVKHAHEKMTSLETDDGRILEDQEEMLQEVYKYYRDLYKAEEDTEEVLEKRRIVVGRIDRSLTGANNITLEEVPTEEFITEIVMDMPKDKSPGLMGSWWKHCRRDGSSYKKTVSRWCRVSGRRRR
ncbi:hypothetical protein R1sor_016735 [Riccia sorocarpa]|uniref:Uncharacterized protein n=1 Tax=Riccia sorocarpa TaxID=122646 RepID=A0ABD3HHV5_9MARC